MHSLKNDELKILGQYFTARQWLRYYKQVDLDDSEYRRFTILISRYHLLEQGEAAKEVRNLSKEEKKKHKITQGSHIKIYEPKHNLILEHAFQVLFKE